jgi:hypothetical protein
MMAVIVVPLGCLSRARTASERHSPQRLPRVSGFKSSNPLWAASYYVGDIAYIIVFPGSLFSREFAGVTGLVSKAIRGRDGVTRDFGWDGYENLSGAISWLTFFAGGARESRPFYLPNFQRVRRYRIDTRRGR